MTNDGSPILRVSILTAGALSQLRSSLGSPIFRSVVVPAFVSERDLQ